MKTLSQPLILSFSTLDYFVLKIKILLVTFSTGNWNSSVKGTEMTLMLFMSATTCKKKVTIQFTSSSIMFF